MIYPKAVTEDGEPVAVTEIDYEVSGPLPVGEYATRPCSWALILLGDTVRFTDSNGDVLEQRVYRVGANAVWLIGFDWVAASRLTLVCGEPSELRQQNPHWRWDR